jgi:DNA-binding XRE family transcriptional regulator
MFDNTNMYIDIASQTLTLPLRASTPHELGELYRAERKALGKTLEQVAQAVGCRRQTIADIEAGKNVGLLTVFMALGVLGRCLEIKSTRYELDSMPDLMGDDA